MTCAVQYSWKAWTFNRKMLKMQSVSFVGPLRKCHVTHGHSTHLRLAKMRKICGEGDSRTEFQLNKIERREEQQCLARCGRVGADSGILGAWDALEKVAWDGTGEMGTSASNKQTGRAWPPKYKEPHKSTGSMLKLYCKVQDKSTKKEYANKWKKMSFINHLKIANLDDSIYHSMPIKIWIWSNDKIQSEKHPGESFMYVLVNTLAIVPFKRWVRSYGQPNSLDPKTSVWNILWS